GSPREQARRRRTEGTVRAGGAPRGLDRGARAATKERARDEGSPREQARRRRTEGTVRAGGAPRGLDRGARAATKERARDEGRPREQAARRRREGTVRAGGAPRGLDRGARAATKERARDEGSPREQARRRRTEGTLMRPQEAVERALELSRADDCIVIADESSTANLRWAGNTLTTNGVTRSSRLTVIALRETGDGVAAGVVSRAAVGADGVEELVRAAEADAAGNEPAEDAAPLVAEGPAGGAAGWDDDPAETGIGVFEGFAPALGEAFAAAEAGGRRLYGFANHMLTSTFLGSSAGLRLRHDQPTGLLEVNAKGAGGSAWA